MPDPWRGDPWLRQIIAAQYASARRTGGGPPLSIGDLNAIEADLLRDFKPDIGARRYSSALDSRIRHLTLTTARGYAPQPVPLTTARPRRFHQDFVDLPQKASRWDRFTTSRPARLASLLYERAREKVAHWPGRPGPLPYHPKGVLRTAWEIITGPVIRFPIISRVARRAIPPIAAALDIWDIQRTARLAISIRTESAQAQQLYREVQTALEQAQIASADATDTRIAAALAAELDFLIAELHACPTDTAIPADTPSLPDTAIPLTGPSVDPRAPRMPPPSLRTSPFERYPEPLHPATQLGPQPSRELQNPFQDSPLADTIHQILRAFRLEEARRDHIDAAR